MSVPNRARRRMASGVAVLGFMGGLLLGAPLTVSASAQGCVQEKEPSSCVRVSGTGLTVDSVAGGVLLSPQQRVLGHYHIYGMGVDFTSGDALYVNESTYFPDTRFGPTYAVNRDLPDGSQVCSSFIENTSDRYSPAYKVHAPMCETIHR